MKNKSICLFTVLIIISCNIPISVEKTENTKPLSSTQISPTKQIDENIPQKPRPTEYPQLTETSITISERPYPSTDNLPSPTPASITDMNIPLYVYNNSNITRVKSPVTSGLPISRSLGISDSKNLQLVDSSGNPVPAQFTPLARWGASLEDSDAPLRWIWIDFQTSLEAETGAYYFLQEGSSNPAPDFPLKIDEDDTVISIDTGSAKFEINKQNGNLNAPNLSKPIMGTALDSDMNVYQTGSPIDISVNLEGAMRASISVKGSYQDSNGNTLLHYTSRYWFYAGLPLVRLFHTVENNKICPLIEYEQIDCFDIGSEGSIDLHELSINLQLETDYPLDFLISDGNAPVVDTLTSDLMLYQDSSGTDFWDAYPNKTDWDGNPLDTRPRMQSYVNQRGYQITMGEEIVNSGNQAQGMLTVSNENIFWTVGVRDFWQNFPKALSASTDGLLKIQLFPGKFGGDDFDFNLRAGEHKTHEIWLSPSPEIPLAPSPLFAQAMPDWYVGSGGFGLTAVRDETVWEEHEQYLYDQLNTSVNHTDNWNVYENLFDAIAQTDFYGIFDYGDLPIDYEGYGLSPLNPKYDYDYGMWLQWARGSDSRWFDLAQAADRHVADIDLLHTLHTPRHWSDGNMFGHSYHDEEGFANPHRNYGGLSPDTAFGMDGMLLLYYLTGYEKAFDSVLELANNIEYRLHNDSYLCSYYIDGECNGNGYVLFNGLYNNGSRPAANSLSIAVSAYRATSDQRYLTVANALVDWANPLNQPYINGPNGQSGEEDFMKPWLLNLYLRALSSYIQTIEEYGISDNYNAKQAYLAYADWLHEYAWIPLEPIESGNRAAYPFSWWFDNRQADPNDEYSEGNNVPSINNWLYLGADAMAYAYHLSSDEKYLEWAAELFRTGSHDEFFKDDESLYTETKQTINALTYGNIFLYEWTASNSINKNK